MVQCRICPDETFGTADNPVDDLFHPRSSVCATRISLGLMISAGMLLASTRRLIFGGPVISPGLPGKSLSAVK